MTTRPAMKHKSTMEKWKQMKRVSVRDNETYVFDNSGLLLDDLLTELAPLMTKNKIARTKTIFQRINNNNRLLVNLKTDVFTLAKVVGVVQVSIHFK